MNVVDYFRNGVRSAQDIEQHWQRLYRVAYSWGQDPQLAADLVQETLAKAMKNRRRLKGADALDKWLYRIMANCWHDYWRQHRDAVDISDATLASAEDPAQDCEAAQLRESVYGAMALLSREHREVVALVDLEGMSYPEVGEVLGIPTGTVKSRLFRAREQLEQSLGRLHTDTTAITTSSIRRIK